MSFHLRIVIAATLMAAAQASGQVTLDVPGTFPDIQSAILASSNGDTVRVSPGVYARSLSIIGRTVRIVSSGGPANTTIRGTAGSALTIAGAGPGTRVEGFTIENGHGNPHGGGFLVNASNLALHDCILRNNSGANGHSGNSTTNGGAGGSGAGMAILSNSTVLITDCTFDSNRAGNGGAGYYVPTPFPAPLRPGGPGGWGGGILAAMGSDVSIARSTFTSNRAGNAGFSPGPQSHPAGSGDGGGIAVVGATLHLEDCTFTGNIGGFEFNQTIGGDGGALFALLATSVTIDRCQFLQNSAGCGPVGMGWGGAIVVGNAVVRDSLFLGNAGSRGGAAFVSASTKTIGCTFANNQGTSGSDLHGTGDHRNDIFYSHPGASPYSIFPSNASISVNFSCVRQVPPGAPFPGTGNVNIAPQFATDFSLLPTSPLIDAGDAAAASAVDLADAPRVSGGAVDMGAFEFPKPALYPGTGEGLTLQTARNDDPLTTGDLKFPRPGDSVSIDVIGDSALVVGTPVLLFGQLALPGTPPIGGFPQLWMDDGSVILLGENYDVTVPALGAVQLSLTTPPGLAGVSAFLQAVAFTPLAGNAFAVMTDAHELRFTP